MEKIANALGFTIELYSARKIRPEARTKNDSIDEGSKPTEDDLAGSSQTLMPPSTINLESDFEDELKPPEDDFSPRLLEPVEQAKPVVTRRWNIQLPIYDSTHRHVQLPFIPLFHPRAYRSLVGAVIATLREGDEIDEPKLVELVASGRLVDRLVYRPYWSLSRSVQLLFDVGEGMDPFARDQMELREELERVAGRGHITELHFRGSPLQGVTDQDGRARIWYPPKPYSVVLAVTDFGIARGSEQDNRTFVKDWLKLSNRLAVQHSHVVALVPYPRARWPVGLSPAIALVPWDWATEIGYVRNVCQRGRA